MGDCSRLLPLSRAQINVLAVRPYIPLLFLPHLPLVRSLPYQREGWGWGCGLEVREDAGRRAELLPKSQESPVGL